MSGQDTGRPKRKLTRAELKAYESRRAAERQRIAARRDEVEIHRLRRLLGWPCDRFDAMVEQLRAESQVALHLGDASDLSDEEQRQIYEVNGQLYFCLSWQK